MRPRKGTSWFADSCSTVWTSAGASGPLVPASYAACATPEPVYPSRGRATAALRDEYCLAPPAVVPMQQGQRQGPGDGDRASAMPCPPPVLLGCTPADLAEALLSPSLPTARQTTRPVALVVVLQGAALLERTVTCVGGLGSCGDGPTPSCPSLGASKGHEAFRRASTEAKKH